MTAVSEKPSLRDRYLTVSLLAAMSPGIGSAISRLKARLKPPAA